MPDLNDYHAFQSTGGEGGENGGGGMGGCLLWILAGAAILWIIGKLAG